MPSSSPIRDNLLGRETSFAAPGIARNDHLTTGHGTEAVKRTQAERGEYVDEK
jgi:hypothetical protein